MDTATNDARLTEALDREYGRQRDNIASTLRDLGGRIERVGPYRSSDAAYAEATAEIMSAINNTMPNLNLGGLVKAAAEADMQIARDLLAIELAKEA